MAPFRFAIQASGAPDVAAWRDLAAKAEDLGYATLYVPDHLDDQWGPFVACTVAAEATTTLNVGPLVLDNDFRHPVVMAKEAATLDLVADGRLELGLGAGWLATDYAQSGMAMDRPGVRIGRLAETLQILDDLWRTGTCTFSGTHYDLHGVAASPTPRSPGGPRLVIGGGGAKILTLAGQRAAIVSVVPDLSAGAIGPEVAASAVADKYRQRIDWVRQAAGERFGDLELQCWTMMAQVVPNAADFFEQFAPVFNLTADQLAAAPVAVLGTEDAVVETLQQRRDELGFSYLVIRDSELEGFAPVVARLAGT